MIKDALISLLISGSIIMLVWYIKGKLLCPVPVSECHKLIAVIQVSGDAGELERTVNGLLWLDENGTLPLEIIIADEGMDHEAKQAARVLAKKNDKIKVCEKADTFAEI